MLGFTVNNKRIQGYSLLEIIIVLAIIGLIMVALANYARKEIESVARQNISNALANEIAGMVKFVHEDEIYTEGSPNPVKNPLYDTGSALQYSMRVANTQLNEHVKNTSYWKWDIANSQRGYFRDARCSNSGDTSGLNFVKEYISCKIDDVLHNQEFRLERVDIVGDSTKRSIERIDFFVGYSPNVKEDNLFFAKYVNEIEKAFENRKLVYSKAMIVWRKKSLSESQWQLLFKNNAPQGDPVELGQLASHLNAFTNKNTKDYGIRFSFVVGEGQYLKSDGSVGADKLCWNAQTQMSGPCLSGNPDNNNQLILSTAVTNNNSAPSLCWDMKANKSKVCIAPNANQTGLHLVDEVTVGGVTTQKTATLMANLVMKDDADELTTVPKVSYHNFRGNGDLIVQDTNYNGNITSAIERNGLIHFRKQTCPVNPESPNPNPIHLYPRLSVAISSIVPVTMVNNGLDINLTNESTNRGGAKNVGKFGGIALQIDQVAAGIMDTTTHPQWVVSATVGVYEDNGAAKNYISPKSLSIIAFTWCSSTPQP